MSRAASKLQLIRRIYNSKLISKKPKRELICI
jgi:hypothetical protein